MSHELYLEDRFTLSNRQALTLGFRYSGDDYLGSGRLEPRLRLDYQISDRLSTYVAAGQYSQRPQLREMIAVLGNPDLAAAKANHFV